MPSKGKSGPSSPVKKKTSKGAKVPQERFFAQEQLDTLLGFSPGAALRMAADALSPSADALNYAQWIQANLPHIFTIPFGPHQQWVCDQFQAKPHGARIGLGAPRGAGKTSLSLIGLPLAALAMGTHEFPVIITNTQLEAEARLAAIRNELERNELLVERFPRLRYVKRARSVRRNKVETRREVQLAGGRIMALGAGARMRGLLRESEGSGLIRPDLLLVDDLEDADQARSKMRTDRLQDWLLADAIQLGSQRRPITAIVIGTTLATDALMTRLLTKRGPFRQWNVQAFPAEYTNEKGSRRPMWPEGLPMGFLQRLLDPRAEEFVGPAIYAREYLLDPQDIAGAMWSESVIGENRHEGELPPMRQIIVGVDPSWGTKGDECGIIVFGLGVDNKGYVLDDRSLRAEPLKWGEAVRDAFVEWGANRIVVEVAFGAEQVKLVMNQVAPTLPFTTLSANKTAPGGGVGGAKARRFDPVSVLYSQGKILHAGTFADLETQMTSWTEESHFSPDRVDALATAVWASMLGKSNAPAKILSATNIPLPQTQPRQQSIRGGRVAIPDGDLRLGSRRVVELPGNTFSGS